MATALVHGKRAGGAITKRNAKTVWIQLGDGKTVKRHKVKHKVKEKS